jgi:5-methylcytosine-specific restriction endonuclease McrA
MTIEKKCLNCGGLFKTNRLEAKFCSSSCYWADMIGKEKKVKVNICRFCKKEFKTNQYLNHKFCSKECYWKSKEGVTFSRKEKIEIICKKCHRKFKVSPSGKNRKFCSKECFTLWHKGKNHYNWQGGKSKEYDKFRNSRKWFKFRREVFERDKYTCQKCGFKNGKGIKHRDLHPHHLKSATKYPKLMLKKENVTTLCHNCHGKIHSINFKRIKNKKKTLINN